MTTARKYQVSLSDTPFYHVMSRCVRRSFLCGIDPYTGQSYEHRRQWVEERIRLLSTIFAIDICSYAVMSNHYHIVLKIDAAAPESWSFDQVIHRWLCLHNGPFLVHRYLKGEVLTPAENIVLEELVENWRERLCSLSEFMQQLNQAIARQANLEEKCTGRFWEGRYKSQPLLTEEALLTAMAYVDLNPVRAKMAETPEASEHTSVKERIRPSFNLAQACSHNPDIHTSHFKRFGIKPLLSFEEVIKHTEQRGILFNEDDYLTLVDTTGRIQRADKRGFISDNYAGTPTPYKEFHAICRVSSIFSPGVKLIKRGWYPRQAFVDPKIYPYSPVQNIASSAWAKPSFLVPSAAGSSRRASTDGLSVPSKEGLVYVPAAYSGDRSYSELI